MGSARLSRRMAWDKSTPLRGAPRKPHGTALDGRREAALGSVALLPARKWRKTQPEAAWRLLKAIPLLAFMLVFVDANATPVSDGPQSYQLLAQDRSRIPCLLKCLGKYVGDLAAAYGRKRQAERAADATRSMAIANANEGFDTCMSSSEIYEVCKAIRDNAIAAANQERSAAAVRIAAAYAADRRVAGAEHATCNTGCSFRRLG